MGGVAGIQNILHDQDVLSREAFFRENGDLHAAARLCSLVAPGAYELDAGGNGKLA